MQGGFQIRAQLLRDLCESAHRRDPRAADAMVGAFSDLDAIARRAFPTTWLDGRLYVDFHERALALFGSDGLFQLGRDSVAVTATGPVLQTLHAMARRMSRGNLTAFLRFFPGSRAILINNGGEVSFVDAPGLARIEFLALPPALAESVAWRIGNAGVLRGIVELAGGACEISYAAAPGPEVRFDVRWWKPSAQPAV